jgi:hypothetical protein
MEEGRTLLEWNWRLVFGDESSGCGKSWKRALDGPRLRDFISVDGTERVASRVRSSCIVDCELYLNIAQPPAFPALQIPTESHHSLFVSMDVVTRHNNDIAQR